MRYLKFKIVHLLLVVLVIALMLASFVERPAVIGQSSTHSPDGNWCLKLRLVEYSTLFASRRMLDAGIEHSTNKEWEVKTSLPLNADAKTISNEHPDYPIIWSDDSSTVSYWINEQLEDSMSIEANDRQFRFQRSLNDFKVTETYDKDGDQ